MIFELTVEEANLIVGALSEQPYKLTAVLIAKMQTQAHKQLNPESKKAEDNK